MLIVNNSHLERLLALIQSVWIMDEMYALNPSKLAKGLSEIVFGCFVAEPANEQRPQGITFDFGVIVGIDYNGIRISPNSALCSDNNER